MPADLVKRRDCYTCGNPVYRATGSYCNDCWRKRNREIYAQDPAKHAAKRREYLAKNPSVLKETNARQNLKKRGVSLDWYNKKAEEQNHLCAICQEPQREVTAGKGTRYRLSVDHDHSCCSDRSSCEKCRRDLLCSACNLMIGNARENISVLIAGIEYLTKWKKQYDK